VDDVDVWIGITWATYPRAACEPSVSTLSVSSLLFPFPLPRPLSLEFNLPIPFRPTPRNLLLSFLLALTPRTTTAAAALLLQLLQARLPDLLEISVRHFLAMALLRGVCVCACGYVCRALVCLGGVHAAGFQGRRRSARADERFSRPERE
jgi:hypothetical protein